MFSKTIFFVLILLSYAAVAGQTVERNPVIIIPGFSGTEMVDAGGKTIWFSIKRGKTDDLRLPLVSKVLARNRDTLRPKDVIRSVDIRFLPDIEVYQPLIDALKAKGYSEAQWDNPKAGNVFYVFPYDWRRDNVESAHLLMRRMAAVRKAVRNPRLKFDILAHSMGGLIARYAAMYGMADLLADGVKPNPNWSGAAYMNKVLMFGTPNQGSFNAFEALLKGSPIIADRKLPLVDDLRPEDIFATPSIFQLLPHPSVARFFDENLKPINLDLYNADTWIKFGWGALADPKFLSKLKDAPRLALTNKDIKPKALDKDANIDDRLTSQTTYAQARTYLVSALSRAKRFHAALDVAEKNTPLELYAFGGNCSQTLDGAVLIHDDKDNKWTTLLEAKDITTRDGKEYKKDQVKDIIYSLGDGRVTQRSLLAATQKMTDGKPEFVDGIYPLKTSKFACGLHIKLFLEKEIQDSFLSALVVEKQAQP
ncbi:MAG: esterase/lipase family protein [Pyrinomonadaceae bacterium]